MEEISRRPNRVNLTIPYSFLDVIDRHVQVRLDDGETRETANRSAFVMEMFKLGLRVYENKKAKDEGQLSLDDKLKMIARNVLISSYLSEAIYHVNKDTADLSKVNKSEHYLDPDFLSMVTERINGKLAEYFK
jgi:hypothetical protein